MKLGKVKTRELLDLALVVIFSTAFALFSISAHFLRTVHDVFHSYTTWPLTEFLANVVFLWLAGLLWITHRCWKEAEKKKQEFEDIVSSIGPDVLIAVDREHDIVTCSSSVERVFGYEVAELIGQKVDMLCSGGVLDQWYRREAGNRLERDGFHTGLATGRKKNGELVPLEAAIGKLTGWSGAVLLLRDITDRERAEEEREKMQALFLEARKMEAIRTLAEGVAHDFNNALAVVLGRAQLLKQHTEGKWAEEIRESTETLKKGLDVIEEAALRGAQTVRRIQEFSKPGTDVHHFTRVDANQLLEDALEFSSARWKDEAGSKGVRIVLEKRPSSPALVAGEPSELREAFIGIIRNAIDAMPEGGEVKVSTSIENREVVVRIEDTGTGIPSEIRDRIFEPFFTTKGPQSAGLGLSISYAITHRHRGTTRAESTKDKGTAVIVTLPLLELPKEEREPIPLRKVKRKASVLVIEDEEAVREVLSDMLTACGHEIEAVSAGSQGIAAFKEKRFDLVFTDLGLPGMSGWQVAQEIKRIDRNAPVALITGWNVQLGAPELRKSGVDLILSKPFKNDQVMNLVEEGLALKEGQAAEATDNREALH
jgi:PAS domain S-box-containing protein